ncbi:MAG: type II toxin-antitoxin system RelE/ParE family toxin [Lachnospiraceae bacterium]|nr:type II toxin-antitoxin system RelE/ParE family toxin [Lachnospiraceae bacterium]
MKKLKYSVLVRQKMKRLKEHLIKEFGDDITKKVLKGITDDADILKEYERSGVNIAKMYNIDTDYWYLFTHQHYLIYRFDEKSVIIVQMFHEREDFMMKLFGISGRTQESIDYWGE